MSPICEPGSAILDQMVILPGENTRHTHGDMAQLTHGKDWGPSRRWSTRGLTVKAKHTADQGYTTDHLPCLSGHTADAGPTTGEADGEVTFLCHACPETHGRPSAVSGSRGHTADTLCRRCHCRVLSAVCPHTAESLRVQKHLCRVNDIHGRPFDSGSDAMSSVYDTSSIYKSYTDDLAHVGFDMGFGGRPLPSR
jgi:hypothetical protein